MGDPRVDEIWRALEEAGILSGQQPGRQSGERSATIAAAAASEVVGNNKNQENNVTDGNPGLVRVVATRPMSKLVEQFLRLKPQRFNGRGDPEAAPRWVEELEKAFEVLGCTEEEKVTLAVYQLQENANDWWRATKN